MRAVDGIGPRYGLLSMEASGQGNAAKSAMYADQHRFSRRRSSNAARYIRFSDHIQLTAISASVIA